jgi:hypothetical protein
MRGGFGTVIPEGHPLAGRIPVYTYAYHADMKGDYGDHWPWSLDGPAALERNRWYCIEQHVQMNTPGQRDGLMQVWVDGRPVLDRRDVRFRDVDELRIDTIWMNVYHGGTAVSPADQHLYVDSVVVARRPVGCRRA